jgi:exopolysaccharide production protein ExoQ
MALHASSVMADHIDTRRIFALSWKRAEDLLVCIILAIHTTAMVSLPVKLAGGNVPGLGLVWALGAIMCLVFASANIKKTLTAAFHAWPILLLTLLIWISYSWTVDPYETMRGAILITCSHLFAFALASRFTWERIIELIAWTLVTLVGLSVFLAIVLPRVGVMQDIHVGAWAGVWPEKQLLGIFACQGVIATLTLATLGKKSSWMWLFGTVLCFIAIIGSTGKTALLMSFIAIGMGVWIRIYKRGFVGAAIAGWIGLVCGVIAILAVSGGLDFILRALGRTSDLTGRTEIWDAVKKLGDMRPMTGWGFSSIWRGETVMTSPYQWVMDWTDFKPANAHSSWLDIYMQLGQPGFALLALCVGWAWFGVLFRGGQNHAATAFAGANLMAITFISFTETNLVGAMDLQWLLVPLLGAKLHYSYRETKKAPPPHPNGGTLDGDTFTFNC